MAGESPSDAIELLGLGRGTLVGSLIEMRADIPDLRHEHPDIAQGYIKLRGEFDATAFYTSPSDEESEYNAHQQLEIAYKPFENSLVLIHS